MNFSFIKSSHIRDEIPTLTSFRFVTAFIVFLFHCKLHFGFHFGVKLIDKFIKNGAVFMTGFFVLSGYILSYVYAKKSFQTSREIFGFYLKRVARLYPVYIAATLVYFIFVRPEMPYVVGDWIRIVINDLFLLQAFFPGMFQLGINGGTWSISVEAFFYFLFPFILLLFAKRPYTLLVVSLFLTVIISVNIIGEKSSLRESIKNYYSNPLLRINEFMTGVAFYWLGARGSLNQLPKWFRSASFVFILIFALTVLNQSNDGHSYMGLNCFIVPLSGLLIFNFHNIGFGPMKNSRVIHYLGRISYSFYMWQFVAIEVGKYLKANYALHVWEIMIMVLFLNIFVSSLSYHLIEEPFRRMILKRGEWSVDRLLRLGSHLSR